MVLKLSSALLPDRGCLIPFKTYMVLKQQHCRRYGDHSLIPFKTYMVLKHLPVTRVSLFGLIPFKTYMVLKLV